MREVYEDQTTELTRRLEEWRGLLAELDRFNAAAKEAGVTAVIVR